MAQVGKVLSLLSLLRFKTLTVRLKYLKMTVAEPPLQVCWTKASLGFFQATILCVPQLARSHETNEAQMTTMILMSFLQLIFIHGQSQDVSHIVLLRVVWLN